MSKWLGFNVQASPCDGSLENLNKIYGVLLGRDVAVLEGVKVDRGVLVGVGVAVGLGVKVGVRDGVGVIVGVRVGGLPKTRKYPLVIQLSPMKN